MRGLVLGVMLLGVGVGVAEAKPCPKGTSRIGKKCVIDRWPATPPTTVKKLPPPTITLAVLHAQPASLDLATDKVVVESKPKPGAIYRAAQAYRAAGDRTKALELYDQYLLVAPSGPAAPAVRAQIEKLRGDVPQ
ncbi:MAG TPA: hypothetical protein VMZ53_27495 [Kofleriaceae bacterium]|nr:hypothetical protein [Kofleriaceae bacterium]